MKQLQYSRRPRQRRYKLLITTEWSGTILASYTLQQYGLVLYWPLIPYSSMVWDYAGLFYITTILSGTITTFYTWSGAILASYTNYNLSWQSCPQLCPRATEDLRVWWRLLKLLENFRLCILSFTRFPHK